jgi:hypothetical protein
MAIAVTRTNARICFGPKYDRSSINSLSLSLFSSKRSLSSLPYMTTICRSAVTHQSTPSHSPTLSSSPHSLFVRRRFCWFARFTVNKNIFTIFGFQRFLDYLFVPELPPLPFDSLLHPRTARRTCISFLPLPVRTAFHFRSAFPAFWLASTFLAVSLSFAF